MSNSTVWRYMDLWKFRLLLKHRALWMSRLGILEDQFEGTLPAKTKADMVRDHLKFAALFPNPDHQKQLAEAAERNVQDGRRVLAVSCWNDQERESKRMWDTYTSAAKGVAIRSTVKDLYTGIRAPQKYTHVSKVQYVDLNEHDMGSYHGHQADKRALLKGLDYSFESEVRIITMNFVCPGTLNEDGTPPSARQLSGPGMYDPNRNGFYLQVDLKTVVHAVIIQPGATPDLKEEVTALCRQSGLSSPVEDSLL